MKFRVLPRNGNLQFFFGAARTIAYLGSKLEGEENEKNNNYNSSNAALVIV